MANVRELNTPFTSNDEPMPLQHFTQTVFEKDCFIPSFSVFFFFFEKMGKNH